MTPTSTGITGVRAVSVQVDDQDAALRFYTGTLGFALERDNPIPGGGRWIELAPGSGHPVVTLELAEPGLTRGPIGIRFTSEDADASHAVLQAAGVEVGEVMHWPGVPAMFSFKDPDGNAFSVTESPATASPGA